MIRSGCRRAGLYSACEGLCCTAFERKEFALSIIRPPNPTVFQRAQEGRWFPAFLSFSLKDPCYIHFQFIVFHPVELNARFSFFFNDRRAAASHNWFLKKNENKKRSRVDTEVKEVLFLFLESWPTGDRNITAGKRCCSGVHSLQAPPTVKTAFLYLDFFPCSFDHA